MTENNKSSGLIGIIVFAVIIFVLLIIGWLAPWFPGI